MGKNLKDQVKLATQSHVNFKRLQALERKGIS